MFLEDHNRGVKNSKPISNFRTYRKHSRALNNKIQCLGRRKGSPQPRGASRRSEINPIHRVGP